MSDRFDSSHVQVFTGLEGVRRLESRFFRSGHFDPIEVASMIVEEALLCGSPDIDVRRIGNWVVVSSSSDWLSEGGHDVSAKAFARVQSYKEGDDDSMRPEVLLAAFARTVVTYADGTPTEIVADETGKESPPPGVETFGRRVVALRV